VIMAPSYVAIIGDIVGTRDGNTSVSRGAALRVHYGLGCAVAAYCAGNHAVGMRMSLLDQLVE
jgi:hypothetical protein